MEIGLMVEGQNGLTWERWLHILALAERLGFPSVHRSDHYFIGPQQDSLEAYLSFAVAAQVTSRIRFGPLVSPVTFRSPVDVGRMAAQLDVLSGGRFVLGLGAGWNEAEHRAYGIPFPGTRERFDRLDEAIGVMEALWAPGANSFEGRYYRLEGADCIPKPTRGRVPLLIGGGGEKRTLKAVARFADEWNSVNLGPEAYRAKLPVLERHCEEQGRDMGTIRRSMMLFAIVGPTAADLDRSTLAIARVFAPGQEVEPAAFREQLKGRGMVAGTAEQVVEQLRPLAELGVAEVQFQHFHFDDDLVPEYLAAEVAPALA